MPVRLRAILLCFALNASLIGLCATPLRVGIEINNGPISFLQPDGQPAGYAVDLVNAVAQEADLPIIVNAGKGDDLRARFKSGEIDALASMAYSDERNRYTSFTVPHLQMDGALFIRKGDHTLKQLADLRTRRIALPPGGFTQEYLTQHGLDQHFIFVPSFAAALQALNAGECDAVAGTLLLAKHLIRTLHLTNIETSEIALPGFSYELRIGLQKDNHAQLAALNDGLARIHANGTYDRIYERWIGPLEARRIRLQDILPYLAPGVLMLVGILAALFWQRRMLRHLARQSAALRASEERLTLVLAGSEDGFWDHDLRTGRIDRSERWASMLGYTLAEIPPTGEGARVLVHPDDRHIYDSLTPRLTSGDGQRCDIEYRMQTKSGDWLWILDRGKVVTRAPDGSAQRMAGTHTDITKLKRAQQEFARQEAQLRFIYEHAPVGISWVQLPHATTRLVNTAHERITGVSRARSHDTANYLAATHPDDRAHQRALETRLASGEIDTFSIEKRYVHADGKIVWAILTMHVYRDPLTGAAQQVTSLVDISDLKRGEQERERLQLKIQETQKLESLGVLAGGIAHDFNNLLTVILVNANLARLTSSAPSGIDDPLQQIEVASKRAADLCRQMLAYAGKGNFLITRLELEPLVRDTAQLLHVAISKKAILQLDLSGHLPAVEADASQIQQVIMNLVINASDALGEAAGEIRLRTWSGRPEPTHDGALYAFDLPQGECACLEVSDTGQGMDAATLARIFDPFFTTKFTGRGLGLAAVLGIVRTHHGALTVTSTPGRGTTFRLYLPATANTAPAAVAPPLPSAAATSGQGVILIADDEPAVLKTLDLLLRRAGFHTVLATDGLEAIRLFRTDPQGFTLLLLDLTMPGLDGAQVLREARTLQPNTRTLIMSGFSEQDVLDRLTGLGPVSLLPKPFTHDLLLERVHAAIAS